MSRSMAVLRSSMVADAPLPVQQLTRHYLELQTGQLAKDTAIPFQVVQTAPVRLHHDCSCLLYFQDTPRGSLMLRTAMPRKDCRRQACDQGIQGKSHSAYVQPAAEDMMRGGLRICCILQADLPLESPPVPEGPKHSGSSRSSAEEVCLCPICATVQDEGSLVRAGLSCRSAGS